MAECTLYRYEDVLARLHALADEKYRDFHAKLVPGEQSIIGVRSPELKKLSRELLSGEWLKFLAEPCAAEQPNEMLVLKGLVVGGAKCGYAEKLEYAAKHVPLLRNWAQVDSLAASFKDTAKHLEQAYAFIQPYLESQAEYEVRFGVVMLLSYFRTDAYIQRTLDNLTRVRHEGCYAKVAVAWAVSCCFISHRAPTLSLLQSGTLDDFTHSRSIQKTIESYRVSDEDKKLLAQLRRKAGVRGKGV